MFLTCIHLFENNFIFLFNLKLACRENTEKIPNPYFLATISTTAKNEVVTKRSFKELLFYVCN